MSWSSDANYTKQFALAKAAAAVPLPRRPDGVRGDDAAAVAKAIGEAAQSRAEKGREKAGRARAHKQ